MSNGNPIFDIGQRTPDPLRVAAEHAERVMEHTARKLAALPLVQNDMAMDLFQAAAELRKARGN